MTDSWAKSALRTEITPSNPAKSIQVNFAFGSRPEQCDQDSPLRKVRKGISTSSKVALSKLVGY